MRKFALGVMTAAVALVAAAEAECEVAQYTSNEVKVALVGYGGATKDQVQRMVASVLGLAEPPRPPDVADALVFVASRPPGQMIDVLHVRSHHSGGEESVVEAARATAEGGVTGEGT